MFIVERRRENDDDMHYDVIGLLDVEKLTEENIEKCISRMEGDTYVCLQGYVDSISALVKMGLKSKGLDYYMKTIRGNECIVNYEEYKFTKVSTIIKLQICNE